MAYTFDFLNEEEKKKQQGDSMQPQQTASVGGGTVVSGGAGAQGAPQQKGSGSFVNLQQYLNANKQQGQQLAQNTTGKVTGEAQQAKDQVTNNENIFNQQVQAGTTQADEAFNKNVVDNATEIFNNPDKGQDKQRVSDVLGATYKGPEQRDTLDDTAKAQAAQQKVEALQNEGGRKSLLQDYYKRPDYTQGQVGLDNLLFGGSQGAAQGFQQAKDQFGGLLNEANQSAIRSGEAVSKGKQDTAAAQQGLKAMLQGAQEKDVADLQKYAQDYAAAKQKYQQSGLDLNDPVMKQVYEQAKNALAPRLQQKWGANTDIDQGLQGWLNQQNLRSGLNTGNNDIFGTNLNAENLASADQRARLQALSGLAGTTPGLNFEAPGAGQNYDQIYNFITRNRSIGGSGIG